jgi:hypothetical protein
MPSTTEESAKAQVCCGNQIQDLITRAEDCALKEPFKASLIAFLAGLVFTVLPVGQIVGGMTRLLFALVRPALIVLGAMKVLEEVEKRRAPKA